MTTTEDIGETTPESGQRMTESLGDGIERAMADAEKRLERLLGRLHSAARGSEAFKGAERDAHRVMDWMEAKSHQVQSELDKLGKDVDKAATKVKEAVGAGRKAQPAADETAASGEPPTES